MNVLDESVPDDQRVQLTEWRVHTRKIGIDVGYLGMLDEAIMPLLHQLTRPTFFSRDRDFYKPTLRHADYCLVWLDTASHETCTSADFWDTRPSTPKRSDWVTSFM